MGKLLWVSCKTTGPDVFKHDITQIGYIVEENGQLMEKHEILMPSGPASHISPETLEEGIHKFETALQRYATRDDPRDKFILAGYNTGFSDKFLRALFKKAGKDYYGAYIIWAKLDVQSFLAKYLVERNISLYNQKLETVCKHFGIEFEACDALGEIKATRKLYTTLTEEMSHV